MKTILDTDLPATGPVYDRVVTIRDALVNLYIVKGPAGLICIDTGWSPISVSRGFRMLNIDVRDVAAVFLTHLHWDHARSLRLFQDVEVFSGTRKAPSSFVKRHGSRQTWNTVSDEETVNIAGLTVRAIDTPGHTNGSVSYVVDEKLLFTGDTLNLRRGKVVPFFSFLNRDNQELRQSICKLARIKGIECLLTAHSGISRDIDGAFTNWRGDNGS